MPAVGSAEPRGIVSSSSVTPHKAFFGADPVRVLFSLDPAEVVGPATVDVLFIRRGNRNRVSWKATLGAVVPGAPREVRWRGLTSRGRAARDGRYRVFVQPTDAPVGERESIGSFRLHGHSFPVRGRHWDRGWLGLFGAPRGKRRRHEGFDVMAPCGTPLVAARAGRVISRGYDPVLYGNYLRIAASNEHRSYFYSHLSSPARPVRGERVATGQTLGRVGRTGNARTIGCHLHFEIRERGRAIDPRRSLMRWDRFS